MRVPQLIATTTTAVLMLTATAVPAGAAAARPKCAVPIVSKVFDHDQTGGWWAVTVDMHCDYKYTKEFVLSVYNRRTREPYFFQTLPTTAGRYHKVVTVPSTPPSAKESACVDASAAIYGPDENPLNSERTYDCFPTTSPA